MAALSASHPVIAGSAHVQRSHACKIGASNPDSSLSVTVILKKGITAAQLADLKSHFTSKSLAVQTHPLDGHLTVSGLVKDVTSTFGVELHDYYSI